MSRLDETLMGIDREASPGLFVEGSAQFVGEDKPRRQWWRVVAPLGFLALVVAFGLAILAGLFAQHPPRDPRAVARSEQTEARGRKDPERTQLYVRSPDDRERRDATLIDAALRDEPFRALMRQGLEMARGGAFAEARQLFERALELNAADPEGWNNLGFVLIRQRDFQRGVEAFRRALRLKPDHVEAHRNLAVALERQGKAREAAHHYRAFLSLSGDSHPDRAEVRRRLAEPESRKSEE